MFDFDWFDIDLTTLLVSFVMYAFVMVGIWKINIGAGWSMLNKVILSVLSLPIIYIITNWQLNR